MKKRRFGRTGLQVSEVVLGAGFVGGLFVLADDDTRRRVLRRALDASINWIDTAPLYGQGRSEEALGWLLPEVKEKPYLSTKVRVDFGKPDLPGQVEHSMHESLKRLKRDSVDLLQLHNAIDASNVEQVLGGALEGLERMRAQKLTRFVGLTALGEAPAIVRAIDSVPHAVKAFWSYDLPLGRGRAAGATMPGWLDAVAGGWQLTGTARVQSGRQVAGSGVRLVGMTLDELQREFRPRVDEATGIVTMLPNDIILNTRRAFSVDPTSATGYSALGVPEGTVASRRNRALRNLREALAGESHDG